MSLPHIPHFTAHLLHFGVVIRESFYCHFLHGNVVGYRTEKALAKGNSLVCMSFLSPGLTGSDVKDLVPGNVGSFVNGEINFRSLDAYGRTVDGSGVLYYGYDGMTGWFDGSTLAPATKTFTPGEAVWIALPGNDEDDVSSISLTNAGEVNATDITLTLRQGNTAIGNMMAINYPIADIEVGNHGPLVNGEINFRSLDAYGRTVEGSGYLYFGYEGMTGWFDGSSYTPASATLAPGQGIWVASTAEGVTLKFYAPDL